MSETGPPAENRAAPEDARCPQCGCPRDATDRFCRRCGRSFEPASEVAGAEKAGAQVVVAQAVTERRARTNWLDTRWGVWLLLSALGPFALPVLWRSRRFTRFGKIAVTLLVVVLTAALVWLLYLVIAALVRSLRELHQLLQGL